MIIYLYFWQCLNSSWKLKKINKRDIFEEIDLDIFTITAKYTFNFSSISGYFNDGTNDEDDFTVFDNYKTNYEFDNLGLYTDPHEVFCDNGIKLKRVNKDRSPTSFDSKKLLNSCKSHSYIIADGHW